MYVCMYVCMYICMYALVKQDVADNHIEILFEIF